MCVGPDPFEIPTGPIDWLWKTPTPTYTWPEVRTTTNVIITSDVSDNEANTAADIERVLDDLKALLLEKNRKYGDSALTPSRVFSRSDAVEQIKVRIDDKLTRLKNAQDDEDEDVVQDLMGYLVLLRIAQQRKKADELVALYEKAQKESSSFGINTSPIGITTFNSEE